MLKDAANLVVGAGEGGILDRDQVHRLDHLLHILRRAASSIPLFIGVDEEGGTVARASRNPYLFLEKCKSPAPGQALGPPPARPPGQDPARWRRPRSLPAQEMGSFPPRCSRRAGNRKDLFRQFLYMQYYWSREFIY